MKCPNCHFSNPSDSSFCEKCGETLKKTPHSTAHTKSTPAAHGEKYAKVLDDDISDVIFQPPKKNSPIGFFVLVGLLILGILFVVWLGSDSTASSPSSPDVLNVVTSSPTLPVVDTMSALTLEDLDSTWIGDTFYLMGTLKNSSSSFLEDIYLRADFYKYENNVGLFDTRYIKVEAIAPQGAFRFQEPVSINPPVEKWWWQLTVETVGTPE